MTIYSYALILDRMDQIHLARGAAAVLAGVELRGGAAPGMANLGLPGVKKGDNWVGRGLRDTHSPPRAFAGLGRLVVGRAASAAALRGGASPARSLWASLGQGSRSVGSACVRRASAGQGKAR